MSIQLLAAAGVIPTAAVLGLFSSLRTTLLEFVVPSAALATAYGGLIHAHVFHTPQAKETGKRIVVDSVWAMAIAGLGPTLLMSLGKILGLP